MSKQFFDFKQNSIEEMNIDTLKRTYRENDIYGNPLRGLYHFQVIEQVAEIARAQGLTTQIETIFAAKNQNKQYPGVSVLPQVEDIEGGQAVEAHILRRVYTTIKIEDNETDELTSNIAIAYHQEGLQIAFGQRVKICTNQTILGADHIAANFGKGKKSNTEIFETVENWMRDFFRYQEKDRRIIETMKNIDCTNDEVMKIIGLLNCIRVKQDTKHGFIRESEMAYPLNQSQISVFVEKYLLEKFNREVAGLGMAHFSLWDIYNMATELHKPGNTDVTNIINQNFATGEVLKQFYTIY